MQTCTGATAGLRRGAADGLGPASMVISLAFGTLLGVPDAADSSGRLVSLPPEALRREHFDIALADGSEDAGGARWSRRWLQHA